MALRKGRVEADVEAREDISHEVRGLPSIPIFQFVLTVLRTGAPAQRGAIVNISSIFGRISHSNVGAVRLD